MKSTSAALAAHLAGPVTTLATCWRISRIDGKEFFFTDHDRDLPFEGNVYKASSGYSRTAIANDAGLSVDNLDVEGVFDSEAIAEEELRAGLFDQAEVRIFLVNWADPAMGALRMRRGWFGEVVLTEQGIFRTELRGMTQALQQRIGELYSPECRADLGDHRCKVPVNPPEIARSTAYIVGDVVRVRTASGYVSETETIALSVVNPGAEAGNTNGWTITDGGFTVRSSDPIPYTGSYYFYGGPSNALARMHQDLVIPIALHESVDAAGIRVEAKWRQRTYASNNDPGAVDFIFLDDMGAVLSTSAGPLAAPTSWTLRSHIAVVPANTRFIRLRLRSERTAGSNNDGYFDDISCDLLVDQETQTLTSAAYENRVYRCVTAGTTASEPPSFDTNVGEQTADGGAVFEAEEAWSRSGIVTAVTDRAVFNATLDEPRAVDGWFAGGVLTWETGANAGRSIEVKGWTQGSGRIELFLPMGYGIEPGDAFRVHPGCDKRLDTCIDRFANVLNFRGEPYVPGQDAMMSYPDAR
ncbi:hypothetical protein GCM10009424_29930 [Sphingomonas ursincola]|uniref:DUF2163 domain-containing protein n=1 Tax=Sphingomonas ursincola TaxID=56361 RepID=A0A7V8RBS0_9SPHN|nr:DUF2163 domain-containing protein [Sphingomonas ursincola]MBA1373275.1 DUF2163 domain-containing protein [Sphingomonas ursincola]